MSRPAFSLEPWCDENHACSGAKLVAVEKSEGLVRDFHESSSKYSKRWYNFIFYKSPSLINASHSLGGGWWGRKRQKNLWFLWRIDIDYNSRSKLQIFLNNDRGAHSLMDGAQSFFPSIFCFELTTPFFFFSFQLGFRWSIHLKTFIFWQRDNWSKLLVAPLTSAYFSLPFIFSFLLFWNHLQTFGGRSLGATRTAALPAYHPNLVTVF